MDAYGLYDPDATVAGVRSATRGPGGTSTRRGITNGTVIIGDIDSPSLFFVFCGIQTTEGGGLVLSAIAASFRTSQQSHVPDAHQPELHTLPVSNSKPWLQHLTI